MNTIMAWISVRVHNTINVTLLHKDNCRYSVGLLLLARVILFLVFSVNVFGDPACH